MRIDYANIPAQVTKPQSSPPSPAVGKTIDKRHSFVTDSYTKNPGHPPKQFIDAEFVELYSPSTKIYNKERNNLDFSIEPEETTEKTASAHKSMSSNPAVKKYQLNTATTDPLPGSLIDIIA